MGNYFSSKNDNKQKEIIQQPNLTTEEKQYIAQKRLEHIGVNNKKVNKLKTKIKLTSIDDNNDKKHRQYVKDLLN